MDCNDSRCYAEFLRTWASSYRQQGVDLAGQGGEVVEHGRQDRIGSRRLRLRSVKRGQRPLSTDGATVYSAAIR